MVQLQGTRNALIVHYVKSVAPLCANYEHVTASSRTSAADDPTTKCAHLVHSRPPAACGSQKVLNLRNRCNRQSEREISI
eukprot:3592919-Prymnesium_polylepis.1